MLLNLELRRLVEYRSPPQEEMVLERDTRTPVHELEKEAALLPKANILSLRTLYPLYNLLLAFESQQLLCSMAQVFAASDQGRGPSFAFRLALGGRAIEVLGIMWVGSLLR